MNSKYKKVKRSPSKLSSNISGAFSFESHFKFHLDNENNYKSIYSYGVPGDNEEENDSEKNHDHLLTYLFRTLLVLFFPILGWFSLKIINKDHKLVVFRCGKIMKIANPGVTFVLPFIDSCQYVSTEIKEDSILSASCPTRDQGLVEIDFSIKYRISNVDYLIRHVIDWKELVLNEARIALLDAVKNFRWSDFDGMRISYDIESHMTQYLSVQLIGIEVIDVKVQKVVQGKEPAPPMDILKKIDFKALGRQLTSMSPFLINPAGEAGTNKDESSADDQTKEKALIAFFEKLEIIKNMALSNNERVRIAKEAVVVEEMPDNPVVVLLTSLIKDFMRGSINMVSLSRIMSEQSLQCLFDDTHKVGQLSSQIDELLRAHNIEGDVLFRVTKYFKSPCHFHFSQQSKLLVNGGCEGHTMLVELV